MILSEHARDLKAKHQLQLRSDFYEFATPSVYYFSFITKIEQVATLQLHSGRTRRAVQDHPSDVRPEAGSSIIEITLPARIVRPELGFWLALGTRTSRIFFRFENELP